MVGLARCLEARLQLLIINFARNSFTAHSNIECVSLELQRFWGVSKSDRDKLRAKCGWRWCRRRPWAPQPGSVDQVSRWFETAIAFACLFLRGIETAVAFAGKKWAFLVQFVDAEVMPVSALPCWGACSGVVGFIVAMFLRPVRQICRPVRPGVCVSAKKLARRQCSHRVGAKKFSLQAQYGRKMLFLGVLGELFRGNAAGRAALGELLRGNAAGGAVLG